MARISIIVPAVGFQTDIDETLVSILENRPADGEVIVPHPTSYVDPYDLSDEVNFVTTDEIDRLSIFNAGLKAARGEVIHTICPGLIATEGWCDAVLEQFENNRNIGAVSPLVVSHRKRRPIRGVAYHVRRGKSLVTSATRLVFPVVESGFYRASALRFMHGFDVRFGEYADIELGLRLRAAGYETVTNEQCEVRSRMGLRHRPHAGYLGGKLRARLFKTAQNHGLTTRLRGWMGVLGEPINNRFGPGTISAMLGHLSVWMTRSPNSICRPIQSRADTAHPQRQRKAA